MELLKLLSANELVAQAISFLVLLFILRKFLWKRFLKVLDDRKERIASELQHIEDSRAQIAMIKSDYENRIGAIEETAAARIQDAVVEGKRMAEVIKEHAAGEAEKIVANAHETIKAEVSKAREDLKKDIVDITIAAASKVIGERLTEEEDRRVVSDFLKSMDKIK